MPSGTFTANAYLSAPIYDDFNRASLGSDYTSVSNLGIVDNALAVVSGAWGEGYLNTVQPAPTIVAYDFYVPANPASPYRGFQVEAAYANLYAYIDNSTPTPATTWKLDLPGPDGSIEFPVMADTWYRAKFFLNKIAGRPVRGKVWKVGDPEPNWLISVNLNTTRSLIFEHYIYLDGLGTKIDNLEIRGGSDFHSFTADAVLEGPGPTAVEGSFTADAELVGEIYVPRPDRPRLSKTVQMSVLKRRPLTFSAFIPPQIPDEKDQDDDPRNRLDCLPPCGPQGAGGSMNGWGAFKVSMTKCSFCNNYFRSDSEFLGRGSAALASAEHCGYCGAHQRDQHVTKLWVNYPNVPNGKFFMRAKMSWDVNGPDSMTVNVYNVGMYPTTEEDGCESSMEWTEGKHVGRFIFTNDAKIVGYIILGQEQYKYQEEPAELVLDSNALDTHIFRFEIDDELTYYKAKFRASNLEWPEE